MAHPLNALDLVLGVRERIHDIDGRIFSEANILDAADKLLLRLWSTIRSAGEHYSGDYEDFPATLATSIGTGILEMQLPFYVGDVQTIEGLQGDKVLPLVRAGMEDKDGAVARGHQGLPAWIFARGQHLPFVQFRGQLNSIGTFRIWFIRNWGSLHYGTASGGGLTTRLIVGTTFGNYRPQPNVYRNMEFEITSDTANAGNVAHMTRIAAFTGGAFTFAPAAPNIITATTSYALILPLPMDGHNYFLEQLTLDLMRRLGSTEEVALHEGEVSRMKEEFEELLVQRDSNEPRRLFSSRMTR